MFMVTQMVLIIVTRLQFAMVYQLYIPQLEALMSPTQSVYNRLYNAIFIVGILERTIHHWQ